jgi:hypothetical protein
MSKTGVGGSTSWERPRSQADNNKQRSVKRVSCFIFLPYYEFAEKTGFFAYWPGFARVVMDKNPVFGLFSVESYYRKGL